MLEALYRNRSRLIWLTWSESSFNRPKNAHAVKQIWKRFPFLILKFLHEIFKTIFSYNRQVRQPFNSRLAAYTASTSSSVAAPLSSSFAFEEADASNPFLLPDSSAQNATFSSFFTDSEPCELRNAPLLDLQSASNLPGGKIQVKGKQQLEEESLLTAFVSVLVVINSGLKVQKPQQQPTKKIVPSFHAARNSSMNASASAAQYRTYGKKRLPIGPDYADFVCRLQNDIPFDSSEEDEEDDEAYGSIVSGKRKFSDESASSNEDEDDSESEDQSEAKIPPQELLELFEDQCQGSASLINRKHQISIKRNLMLIAAAKKAALSPLMSQEQFDQLQRQLSQVSQVKMTQESSLFLLLVCSISNF